MVIPRRWCVSMVELTHVKERWVCQECVLPYGECWGLNMYSDLWPLCCPSLHLLYGNLIESTILCRTVNKNRVIFKKTEKAWLRPGPPCFRWETAPERSKVFPGSSYLLWTWRKYSDVLMLWCQRDPGGSVPHGVLQLTFTWIFTLKKAVSLWNVSVN